MNDDDDDPVGRGRIPPHIDESGLVGRAVPERPTDRVVRNIAILRLCISDES